MRAFMDVYVDQYGAAPENDQGKNNEGGEEDVRHDEGG
jgi:hypothetical protein